VEPSRARATFFNRLPSSLYLWTAALIFAASGSITRKVTEIGAAHLVNGQNPISLCNVLFVGNLCALAAMLPIFGKQWNRQTLSQLTRRNWISLGLLAVLSGAVGPGLIFSALDKTNVTNMVLIGRLEPPLTLALSIVFLRIQVNAWTVAGSLIAFVGVATTALLASSSRMIPMMGGVLQIGQGELQVGLAAVIFSITTIISKTQLQQVPLGIFTLVRLSLGTVIFFVLAQLLYGPHHFAQVLSPFLWKWMLLYSAVIVVIGQLCWLTGLRGSMPAEVALVSSVNPLAAVIMAYFILGEVPSPAQYTGGLIILVGIVLSFIGSLHTAKSQVRRTKITPTDQMEPTMGFRGM